MQSVPQTSPPDPAPDPDAARKGWMSLLAKAPAARLAALWEGSGLADETAGHEWLRRPECGAVMLRGRAGAVGAPFNLGEMTVTRGSLRLASGEVGHAWVQGRDKRKATVAALADALMQTGAAARVEAAILEPLREEAEARATARAARAAATKVEFFTLVRGED
ncbi:phosphonate C-P lyase system protein PhnG [Albimonas sp. CAU 1670]|uniref:phosphonate C-P lyase system protein PhnG n=1 Tax=Albimonas sp. CAU 1670 TaxID=3032599 RepID=UPI0023DAB403|nr:phosphonate C-P lyase system protein PhnG [Albimonas sp. CAU 1670]MDF2232042.1 phosphonate C-P lyase system protein PhnG [Albimonas sp. CAU 1670]